MINKLRLPFLASVIFFISSIFFIPLQSSEIKTQLILLGTGTPNAEPQRSGPSLAVVVGDNSYIVDFGPGIVRRATALSKQWEGSFQALDPENLKIAFLTHLHSDHTGGYPDLILTPWVLGRETPLEVYGPKGLSKMTELIIEAYKQDIDYRLEGLEPANQYGWMVNVYEIEEGIVYRDELVEVTAFKVNHGSWDNAFGYKFVTPDKTIVISGDTGPSGNLINYSKEADILVHEVYSQAGFEKKDEVWKKYHSTHHTSTYELGEIANIIKPGLLVLTHVLFWGSTEKEILDEIHEVYNGPVSFGSDLMVY